MTADLAFYSTHKWPEAFFGLRKILKADFSLKTHFYEFVDKSALKISAQSKNVAALF